MESFSEKDIDQSIKEIMGHNKPMFPQGEITFTDEGIVKLKADFDIVDCDASSTESFFASVIIFLDPYIGWSISYNLSEEDMRNFDEFLKKAFPGMEINGGLSPEEDNE